MFFYLLFCILQYYLLLEFLTDGKYLIGSCLKVMIIHIHKVHQYILMHLRYEFCYNLQVI